MNKAVRFFEGFVMGSLLGATLALLLTPTSGEELRSRIQSEAERVRSEVMEAAGERRIELEQQLANMRAPRQSDQV